MNPMGKMVGNMMQNMMGNNPLTQMMKMMQSGGNPHQLIQSFMEQNPQMKQAMPFIKGKSPEQLQQTFYNMCKERGIDPQQVAQSVGINLPK